MNTGKSLIDYLKVLIFSLIIFLSIALPGSCEITNNQSTKDSNLRSRKEISTLISKYTLQQFKENKFIRLPIQKLVQAFGFNYCSEEEIRKIRLDPEKLKLTIRTSDKFRKKFNTYIGQAGNNLSGLSQSLLSEKDSLLSEKYSLGCVAPLFIPAATEQTIGLNQQKILQPARLSSENLICASLPDLAVGSAEEDHFYEFRANIKQFTAYISKKRLIDKLQKQSEQINRKNGVNKKYLNLKFDEQQLRLFRTINTFLSKHYTEACEKAIEPAGDRLARPTCMKTINARWNANPEPDISHYFLKYGKNSGQYDHMVSAGKNTFYQLELQGDETYYAVVSAVNTAGLESENSDEVSVHIVCCEGANELILAPATFERDPQSTDPRVHIYTASFDHSKWSYSMQYTKNMAEWNAVPSEDVIQTPTGIMYHVIEGVDPLNPEGAPIKAAFFRVKLESKEDPVQCGTTRSINIVSSPQELNSGISKLSGYGIKARGSMSPSEPLWTGGDNNGKIHGICGAAAATYGSTATHFTEKLCYTGTLESTVSFPESGQSVSWTCLGAEEGINSLCSAHKESTSTGGGTNGNCGGASRVYSFSETNFTGSLCSSGVLDPASVVFPTPGESVSWACKGENGGTNAGCSAARESATPVNGACGTAARSYLSSDSAYSGTICAAGTALPASPAFPVQGDSVSWECNGTDGGTDISCSASRDALLIPVDGICGNAAKAYSFFETSFSGTICDSGTALPASPAFPAQGASVSWNCNGSNGGANISCMARRSVDCTNPQGVTTLNFAHPEQSTYKIACAAGSRFQKMQESADLSTWTDVAGSTVTGPDGLAGSSFDGCYTHSFDFRTAPRKFFRAVCLPDVPVELQAGQSYVDRLLTHQNVKAIWDFDSVANPEADLTGQHNLTKYGYPGFTDGYKTGSRALLSSYMNCMFIKGSDYQQSPLIRDNDSFVLSAWLKTTATTFGSALFMYTPTIYGDPRIWFMLGAGGALQADLGTYPTGTIRLIGGTKINDGNWHQLALEVDGNTVRIVIDGQIDRTATRGGSNDCGIISNGELDISSCRKDFFHETVAKSFGIGANNENCNAAYFNGAAIDDPIVALITDSSKLRAN